MKTKILAAGAAFLDGDRFGCRRRNAHHSFAMFDSGAAQAHRGPGDGVELQQPA